MRRFACLLASVAILAVACASPGPSATPPALASLAAGATPSATPAPTPRPSPTPQLNPALPTPDAILPASTCTQDGALCTRLEVATWRSVPFTPAIPCSNTGTTCKLLMSIWAPTSFGAWPTLVLIPGPGAPVDADSYVDDLARQVAGRGVVVMRANWRRSRDQAGGYPTSFTDVACAVGVARKIGPIYGGTGPRVVLAGHSLGGWISSVVALSPVPLTPAPKSCDAISGSTRPDAWAGIAASLELPAVPDASLREFLVGDRKQAPRVWAGVEPIVLVGRLKTEDRIPMTIIQGGADDPKTVAYASTFQDELVKRGFDSVLVEVPTADHPGILGVEETVDALFALAGD